MPTNLRKALDPLLISSLPNYMICGFESDANPHSSFVIVSKPAFYSTLMNYVDIRHKIDEDFHYKINRPDPDLEFIFEYNVITQNVQMKFVGLNKLQLPNINANYTYRVVDIEQAVQTLLSNTNTVQKAWAAANSLPIGNSPVTQQYVDDLLKTTSNEDKGRCTHDWRDYIGLRESFQYCSKCDEKKRI